MATAHPARRRARTALAALTALLLPACSAFGSERSQGPATPGTGSATAAPAVSESLRPYYEQELNWRPCDEPGFQCATLNVPLDYGDIDPAEDLQLSLSRRRAGSPADRIGSLLLNPGGPGASGIGFLQGFAAHGLPADIRSGYDLVGFDPRGTGRSEPVACMDGAAMDAFTATDRTPDDDAEIDALLDAFTAFAESCRDRSGRLLEHISTENAARDLDILRAVLNDDTLHYYGASYGTLLGATYADLFPHRVGRLVLDAAVDPSLSAYETDLQQAAGFETALASFLASCPTLASGPCPLTTPDSLSALLTRLDADPLPTNDPGRPLTESLALTGVAMALYSPSSWPQLRTALAAAIDDGDGAPLLALSDAYHDRGPDGSYGTLMYAFPAISCLDHPPALTGPDAVVSALPDFTAASPTFGADFAWSTLLCASWPVPSPHEPGPVTAPGTPPILVLGTTRDPATPHAWAESLASQLGTGVLLTHDGDGHGAYPGTTCVNDAVNAYLLTGTTPPPDTTCT
ncbi:alpha/beta hydrolase [Streptomyces sp. YIM 98790]|uniref:alpha/beta hydrolase n=1 Tax=Streptomyces sp. YIM 98790 TaxID=2689077 RepID=UPI001409150F|nr:alpha/beta hydrolase [Streptomyces sp. YIM 98790]